MKKYSISKFVSGDFKENEKIINRIIAHLKRNRIPYQVIGTTIIILVTGGLDGTASAAGSFDSGMSTLYYKVVGIGKWILAIKGGIDVIGGVTTGDFDSAKKKAIGYLLAFLILLALPWSFNQLENIFNNLSVTETGVGGQ